MTRKDYQAIACALAGAYPIPENNTPASAWLLCVEALADTLAADNSAFRRDLFIKACRGVTK